MHANDVVALFTSLRDREVTELPLAKAPEKTQSPLVRSESEIEPATRS